MEPSLRTMPKVAPGLRRRAYTYACGLFVEVLLIVACFCWMSEGTPCEVPSRYGEESSHGPCDEATFLFCIFYLGLSKDLAFFLAGLKTEEWGNEANRVRNIFGQYVASVIFFGLACAVSAALYVMQPTDHLARRVVYIAGGAAPNLAVVIDCFGLTVSACRKGHRALFPEVEEIRPYTYDELLENKSLQRTWHHKECSICLESFEGAESVMRLPCGHVFHTDCVMHWLRQTMTCPVRCQLEYFIVALPSGEFPNQGVKWLQVEDPCRCLRVATRRVLPAPAEEPGERRQAPAPDPQQADGSPGAAQEAPRESHSNVVPPVMFGVPDTVQYLD